jgi:hypothetical protein
MAGPRLSDEVDLTSHRNKKPKPLRINLFRASLSAFLFGICLVLLGVTLTHYFWMLGMFLTGGGVIFPFIYMFIALRLIAENVDGDEPEPIEEEAPTFDARR